MAKKTMEEEKSEEKKTPVTVELTENAALALALASERVQSAQTLAQLRQTELQATLTAITTEFAENGKFRVTEVNVEKRTVTRVEV